MVVTGIERQKRHPDRVNIYLDGTFAFQVQEGVRKKYGLREGGRIDNRTLRAITSDEEVNLARQKAFRLLRFRMRSEHELRSRLREDEFSPRSIERVVSHLRDIGCLDDKSFAHALVHDLQLKRPAGRRFLSVQLRKKGIPQPLIEEAIDGGSQRDEGALAFAAASALLERLRRSRKPSPDQKLARKLSDYLLRRGFEWSVVSSVVRKLLPGPAV